VDWCKDTIIFDTDGGFVEAAYDWADREAESRRDEDCLFGAGERWCGV